MRLIPVLCLLLALTVPAVALAAAPAATTGPASGVGRSAATLNGTVNPGGAATSWHFEYGTTTAYGLPSGGGDAGAGSADVPVSMQVSGLSAGTTYHFRVVATNADGTVTGADGTFRTAAGPSLPSISATAAREVGPTSASLRSRIDPNRGATSYHFEYGLSQSYGSRTPEREIGSGGTGGALAHAGGGPPPYLPYNNPLLAAH